MVFRATAVCSSNQRCQLVRRALELVLATFGAGVLVAIAGSFWYQEAASGGIEWPLPALVLVIVGGLGVVGLAAVCMDEGPRAYRWRALARVVTGALLAIMVLGFFSIGPLMFPAVVAFGVAGVLADWRQGRKGRDHIALTMAGGVLIGVLLIALVVLVQT